MNVHFGLSPESREAIHMAKATDDGRPGFADYCDALRALRTV